MQKRDISLWFIRNATREAKTNASPTKKSDARLSPQELRHLADRMVASKDPAEVERLKKELERGFYGDLELIKTFLRPGQAALGQEMV